MLVGCVPKATENSQNLHKHINKTSHTDYSSVIRKCRGKKGRKSIMKVSVDVYCWNKSTLSGLKRVIKENQKN